MLKKVKYQNDLAICYWTFCLKSGFWVDKKKGGYEKNWNSDCGIFFTINKQIKSYVIFQYFENFFLKSHTWSNFLNHHAATSYNISNIRMIRKKLGFN